MFKVFEEALFEAGVDDFLDVFGYVGLAETVLETSQDTFVHLWEDGLLKPVLELHLELEDQVRNDLMFHTPLVCAPQAFVELTNS